LKKLIQSFFLVLGLPLALNAAEVPAKIENVVPHPWTIQEVPGKILDKLSSGHFSISNILFDTIDSITFFGGEQGDFDYNFKVTRKVFDNHNIINSWTVVDSFSQKGKIPFYTHTKGPFALWFGTTEGIRITNIRQVLPDNVISLPEKKEWAKEPSENLKLTTEDSGWLWENMIDEEGNSKFKIIQNTPENKARFSKLSNLFLLPGKLPFTMRAVKNMEEGEIISYTISGAFELGGKLSWDFEPTGSIPSGVGASYTTYLRGSYKISVLKEDNQHVKLKITRLVAKGRKGSLFDEHRPDILDGIFVLKNLKGAVKIVPYSVGIKREWGKFFDLGYRYNIENPHAREAFKRAAFGRSALSYELSFDEEGEATDFEETGVQRIFSGESIFQSDNFKQGIKLTFAYKSQRNHNRKNIEAKITLPDGSYHTFDSLITNSKRWKLAWGAFEKQNYNFAISANLNRFAEDPEADDVFILTAEGSIDDSHASSEELTDYILEAEDAIGQPGIIPRPPRNFELVDAKKRKRFLNRWRARKYGRARIYYRLKIAQTQLEMFMNTPDQEKWGMLEKVFHVNEGSWSNMPLRSINSLFSGILVILSSPLELIGNPFHKQNKIFHARRVIQTWNATSNLTDIRDKVSGLGDLFYSTYYSRELIHLLRLALDGEPIEYTLSAYSPVFGDIWHEGETKLSFENLATKFQKEIDFDRIGPRTPTSEGGTRILKASAEALDSQTLKVKLRLEKKPSAIFFEVLERDHFSLIPTKSRLGHFILLNDGSFHSGDNTIILDNSIKEWADIADKLRPGKEYRIRIAINVAGLNWGPAHRSHFTAKEGVLKALNLSLF